MRVPMNDDVRKHKYASKYELRNGSTFHGANLPIPVCRLVAEDSEKSEALGNTLSGGLCGMVSASGGGGSRD
jgi:hypothetical protein